jgi:hypothetical protein
MLSIIFYAPSHAAVRKRGLVNIHNNHATEGKEPLLPVLLVAASLEAFESALQMRSRSRSRRRLMTTLFLLSALLEQR